MTVSGKGSYSGYVSVRRSVKGFDHLTWIIPVATVSALGISFGVLMLLKVLRRRRALIPTPTGGAPVPKPEPNREAPLPEREGDAPKDTDGEA